MDYLGICSFFSFFFFAVVRFLVVISGVRPPKIRTLRSGFLEKVGKSVACLLPVF